MGYKVVYNDCFGGFNLSLQCREYLISHGHREGEKLERHDKILVDAIEKLGSAACSGQFSVLRIAEISGNVYRIERYDGCEKVLEPKDVDDWVFIEDETQNFLFT